MKRTLILLIGFCLIGWWGSSGGAEVSDMREAEILGVAAEGPSRQPYVVLRERGGKGIVEIFIGPAEAQAIAIALNRQNPPRPLAYDLMIAIFKALKVEIKGVFIVDLRESIYYAVLSLEAPGQELSFDLRPSDGIALALRAGAPIWVHRGLLRKPPSNPEGPEQGGSYGKEASVETGTSCASSTGSAILEITNVIPTRGWWEKLVGAALVCPLEEMPETPILQLSSRWNSDMVS